MSLENAPDEVKLAVDLIMLLENHEIPAETVLKALEIVRRDFEGKVKAGYPHPSPLPKGEGKSFRRVSDRHP
ncbi:pleiotropic regulatory protein RsmS [Enterobacter cloacae]|uniref:pleiotropic regulatory protein RsmS n=1 Tax=Enterobacter cloacae TaxID=550 RepID=UPI001C8449F9|nr:pleiotropic regulatory protein RsmS [Enterobacter cloacae]